MHPPVDQLQRRFLLHLLPRGFVPIRNFGFLANRHRASLLPLCFHLFHSAGLPQQIEAAQTSTQTRSATLWNCPVCCRTMHLVAHLSAAPLLLRSPPLSRERAPLTH